MVAPEWLADVDRIRALAPEARLLEVANLSALTSAGRVDLLFHPAGVVSLDELATEAERFEVFGVALLVAPLRAILRMKEAADRPKDRQDAAVIRAMIARDAAT